MKDGVLVYDGEGRITYAGPEARRRAEARQGRPGRSTIPGIS